MTGRLAAALAPLAALLALAGCGGASHSASGTGTRTGATTAVRSSDPEAAVRAYVGAHDAYAALARGYRVVVSERVTPEFGVVAIQRGARIAAFPLQLDGTTWRVRAGGPLRVRPLGPRPGAREDVVAQAAAAIDGSGGRGVSTMWIDGATVIPITKEFAGKVTIYSNFDPPLSKGRHSAVVFASVGHEAAAAAWTFVSTKG